MRSRLLAGVPALLLLATFSACGDDTTASDAAPVDKLTESTDSPSSDTSSGAPAGSCEYVQDGQPAKQGIELPPAQPKYSAAVTTVWKTSIGDLTVVLDGDRTPCTVGSFLSLAEQGYYDNTSCHRQGNDPGFEFLQCGDPYFDPKAAEPDPKTGTSSPGYTIPDELSGEETYPAGTLAMANTGSPNSGGGQFFIVFGDSQFPPSYTVWGKLDDASLATLKKATASGNDGFWAQSGGGRPNTPVTFKSISVN